MSANGEAGNDCCKAAAWVWYQRGASSSCAQKSGDLMKRRTSNRKEAEEMKQRPSRFKREAAAADPDHYLQTTPPSPAAPHEHQHVDHSSERSPQRSPIACRNCLLSPTSPGKQPAALDHCAHCVSRMSPAPRRKSESLPPVRNRGTEKLFRISSRKSFSSLHSSVDSLHNVCSTDLELMSLAGNLSGQLNIGDAMAAFHSPNCARSSLLDSFELHAVLKRLGYEAHDHDLKEPALRSLEKEKREQALGNYHRDLSPSPVHCKQSLYDLLGWSERGLNTKGCSCTSEVDDCSSDHYYPGESPEINIGSCSSSNCNSKIEDQVRKRQRRRRPSILLPHLPHSFSNALHHMHLPHLPHSFSNALHQLPHSLSNALHHLPHLPHSFSNVFHQIAHLPHSLSSAYRHLHTASQNQNVNDDSADRFHTNDVDAAPSAASPHRHKHKHQHQHLILPHLRHLLSFKTHHSPPHPSCSPPAFDSVPQAANCGINTAPALTQHCLRSSPSFDQNLSKSDDYMLIYSSAKKHSNRGTVHHHHHHHYHHYHYVF